MNDSSQATIHKWLQEAQTMLKQADISSYPLDCLILVEYVTELNRAHILAHKDRLLSQEHLKQLNEMLSKRAKRIPIAYLTGYREFYGHEFLVNEHVLIPRPESEAFIELSMKLPKNVSLLDVGCGSGAIGISVKLSRPDIDVMLSDISPSALHVARNNADRLKADVSTIKMDLISNLNTNIDVIVSNLPYIPPTMKLENDLAYEPPIALFSDNKGMAHYQRLWQQIKLLESHPQFVLTESLLTQHAPMLNLAHNAGYSQLSREGLVQMFKNTSSEARLQA